MAPPAHADGPRHAPGDERVGGGRVASASASVAVEPGRKRARHSARFDGKEGAEADVRRERDRADDGEAAVDRDVASGADAGDGAVHRADADASADAFATPAHDALRFFFVRSRAEAHAALDSSRAAKSVRGYAPRYTHQLFDGEVVRGYRAPRISILYASCSLHCYVHFAHSGATATSGDDGGDGGDSGGDPSATTAVLPILRSHLGRHWCATWDEFLACVHSQPRDAQDKMDDASESLEPLANAKEQRQSPSQPCGGRATAPREGRRSRSDATVAGALRPPFADAVDGSTTRMCHEYRRRSVDGSCTDDEFVMFYTPSLAASSPSARAFHARASFLALLSIDAASYIDDTNARWAMYTLFRRGRAGGGTNCCTAFVGYVTVYRFPAFDAEAGGGRGGGGSSGSVLDNFGRERVRVCQVLIAPPFQRHGHGSEALRAIYRHVAAAMPSVVQVTVEDPNEQFRTLRDVVDTEVCLDDGGTVGAWARAIDVDTEPPPPPPPLSLQADSVGGDGDVPAAASAVSAAAAATTTTTEAPAGTERTSLQRLASTMRITTAQMRRVYELLRLDALERRHGGVLRARSGEHAADGVDSAGASAAAAAAAAARKRYRLAVKRRLYKDNAEIFGLDDADDRKRKLERMYAELVTDEYHVVLRALRKRRQLRQRERDGGRQESEAPRRWQNA